MKLLDQDKKHYFSGEKGLEGELKFDQLTENLHSECIIINGLLLKVDNNFFQIDTLIIFQKAIYLIDVKNYEGDYQFDAKHLQHIKSEKIIKDPFIQLQRCETLLHQLLQQLGFHYQVESYLVYINPEFTLYQAPQNPSVIFPTQIKSFFKKLNTVPSKLTNGHENLADLLISMDLGDYPFPQLPVYKYEQLDKRIICPCCWGVMFAENDMKLKCDKCGFEENVDKAVLRCVKEFKILFPDWKITTNIIFEWCSIVRSKRTIRRILQKYYQPCGQGKHCYYI